MLCPACPMNDYCDKSTAFQQARLKSERLRILILLAVIGVVFGVRTFRTALYHNSGNIHLWMIMAASLAPVVAYEWLMLRAVDRAIQAGRPLPAATWIASILLETSLPALFIAFLSGNSLEPAYKPLANPATLVFFIFITLSTLHLNPAASQLSGFVAAVSYLAAALYVGWRPSFSVAESVMAPNKTVTVYAITLVVAGFVAGAVAREFGSKSKRRFMRPRPSTKWNGWSTTLTSRVRFNNPCFPPRCLSSKDSRLPLGISQPIKLAETTSIGSLSQKEKSWWL